MALDRTSAVQCRTQEVSHGCSALLASPPFANLHRVVPEINNMRALWCFDQALEACASCNRQPGIQLAALQAVGSQIRSACAGKEPDQAAVGWAGDCFAAVAPAAVVCARETAQDPSMASLDAQRTQVRAVLPTACARVQCPVALPLLRPLRLRALWRMRRILQSLQQILKGRRSGYDTSMHMQGCTVLLHLTAWASLPRLAVQGSSLGV